MRNTLTRTLACAALALSLTALARAQSAFVDAKGESSIFIKEGGGFARINATDKSIELGYLRDRGDERPYFGFSVKGKASGDFASLFNGGTPSPEAEVGFTVGKRFFLLAESDKAITDRCMALMEKDLLADFPKLVEGAKKEFVEARKAARVERLKKSLAAEIKAALVREAVARGVPEDVAKDAAESMSAKLVEAAATRTAEEQLKAEADALHPATVEKMARDKANDDASILCVQEDPALVQRSVDWIAFRVAYNRASYKLLNEAGGFDEQVRKQSFDGFSATLGFNTLITLDDVGRLKAQRAALGDARRADRRAPKETAQESKGAMIVGVSIGVRRKNNADDLKSVEIEDQSFTSASGTTQRRALSKQTVLRGEYKEFTSVPLNTDVVWYPGALQSRLAIDFFTRSDLSKTGRDFRPGVGVFITEQGKPTKVVGGISFSYDDGKGKIGLVGGFHF